MKKKKKPLGAARICSERFAFPRFPILLPCSKIFFPFCLSFPLRALRFFGVLPSLLHPIDSLSLSLSLSSCMASLGLLMAGFNRRRCQADYLWFWEESGKREIEGSGEIPTAQEKLWAASSSLSV